VTISPIVKRRDWTPPPTAANSAFVSPVKKVQRDLNSDDELVDQNALEDAVSSEEKPNDSSK